MKSGIRMTLASVAALPAVWMFAAGVLAGPPGLLDSDGDLVADFVDNCVFVWNSGQRDDDLDGYGNACDFDLNQDCIAGGADVGLVGQFWLQTPPWTPNPVGNGTIGAFDINQDDVIGGADVGQIAGNWLGPNGASGYACAGWCSGTTQVAPPPASCP